MAFKISIIKTSTIETINDCLWIMNRFYSTIKLLEGFL